MSPYLSKSEECYQISSHNNIIESNNQSINMPTSLISKIYHNYTRLIMYTDSCHQYGIFRAESQVSRPWNIPTERSEKGQLYMYLQAK